MDKSFSRYYQQPLIKLYSILFTRMNEKKDATLYKLAKFWSSLTAYKFQRFQMFKRFKKSGEPFKPLKLFKLIKVPMHLHPLV